MCGDRRQDDHQPAAHDSQRTEAGTARYGHKISVDVGVTFKLNKLGSGVWSLARQLGDLFIGAEAVKENTITSLARNPLQCRACFDSLEEI
jgi:hypothetical protein